MWARRDPRGWGECVPRVSVGACERHTEKERERVWARGMGERCHWTLGERGCHDDGSRLLHREMWESGIPEGTWRLTDVAAKALGSIVPTQVPTQVALPLLMSNSGLLCMM